MKTRHSIPAFLMVVLAASVWPLLTTVFAAPLPRHVPWVLALAWALSALAVRGRFADGRFELRHLVAVPLLGLAAWLLPWPLSLGAMVLGAALLLGGLLRSHPGAKTAAVGLAVLGIVLVFQGLALHPVLHAMSRWHVVPYLSHGVAALLNFLGAEAAAGIDSFGVDSVTLVTARESYRVPMSTELLGFPVALLALVGGLLAVTCLGEPKKRLRTTLILLVSWVLYLPLRAAALLLLFVQLQLHVDYFAETVRVDILWNPWWQLAGFIPLALAWAFGCRTGAEVEERPPALSRYRPVRHTLALGAALAGAALIAFSLCYHEVGTPKAKRVLIDERYSDWEKTTRAPGTRWYGTLSMYNMFSISDYLEYHYEVVRNTRPLTRETLAGVDVVILKTPTRGYPAEEIEAVVDFVRRGGGLFMIGEHTNYVGSSVHLNSVASRFGLRFREDCLFNLAGKNHFVQVWRRGALFPHPITAHIPFLRFEISCSVTSNSPRTDAVMLSSGLYQLYADYHMQNYYPVPRKSSRMHFGPFLQFAARDFGRGRVAAYADSTNLSNFSAFYPGRAELVLGSVDWLGRTHSSGTWRWVLAGVGVLLLASAAVVFSRLPDRVGSLSLFAAGIVFGAVAALVVSRALLRRNCDLPRPHTKPVHVAFLRERCDYELPTVDFVRDSDRSYNLFNQWVLRVRYFPRVRETLEDSVGDDLVVIINPDRVFRARDVRLLYRYLDSGGKALVLLRRPSDVSANVLLRPFMRALARVRSASKTIALRSLLEPFELELDRSVAVRSVPLVSAGGRPTGVVTGGLVVRGGKTLYRMNGQPAAAVRDVGKGKLLVVGFGDTFRDSGMGHTNATLPDPQLKARFKLQFKLLRFLLPPAERLPGEVLREVEKDAAWMK